MVFHSLPAVLRIRSRLCFGASVTYKMYPCPPSQGWAALPSSCLPSQAQTQHHLISTIHLPEPSLHHLIKYFKTHLLICPGGKNPIPMLSSPKQKSSKDYLYQKCAARVSWPRSQILNFAPSLQGLSNMWLKTSPLKPWGLSHRPGGSTTLCCRGAEKKRWLLVPYHITPSIAASQATILG